MSAQELPYPDCLDKYKLFAQFLLQGKVRYDNKNHFYYTSSLTSLYIGDTHTGGVHPTPHGLTCCHGEEVVKVSV